MNESVFSATSQQIVEKLPQGVVVIDSQGECSWANKALLALLGSGLNQLDDLSEAQRAQLEGWISSVAAKTTDGTVLKKSCIELSEGGHAFLFEPQQATKDLNDPLTGLATQWGISIALRTLLSVARRYEKPLSVGLVRINNLDQLPHDQALLALSQCLKNELRWADLVGRNSDNSFVIVLPETDQRAADALQEKLSQTLIQAYSDDGVEPKYHVVVLESNKRDDTAGLLKRLEAQSMK
ncbi:hypothetical protein MNBD_GAMMA18-1139 [hydrothermal vent metagenome]|uniref:GGDEF domain-containing protein n=1 Tax=hydrothermal vent metagenome TaxID=652676 RepID=A0A3B0ZCI3_9ZZZZ